MKKIIIGVIVAVLLIVIGVFFATKKSVKNAEETVATVSEIEETTTLQ